MHLVRGSWFLTGVIIFGCALIAVFFAALGFAAWNPIKEWRAFRASQRKGQEMKKLPKVLAAAFYGVLGVALVASAWLTFLDARWAFAFILVCLLIAWIVSEDYRHQKEVQEDEAAELARQEAEEAAEIEAALLRHPAGRGRAHVPSQTTPQTAEDATAGDF